MERICTKGERGKAAQPIMLTSLFPDLPSAGPAMGGAVIAFILTFAALKSRFSFLPKDKGRALAVDGEKSRGKIRGVGLVMAVCFVVCSLLFVSVSAEYLILCGVFLLEMLSGYLDDASKKSWSDYKKGLIDLCLAAGFMVSYVHFNPTEAAFFGLSFTLNPWLYGVLGTALIWLSINVTNCSDGVDGLCACQSTVVLLSYAVLFGDALGDWRWYAVILCAVVLAYLWFNSYPSTMLMGDAGSRMLGFFFAVLAMKSGHPFSFLVLCLVMILDGGSGMVKIFLKRFFKISVLKDTLTPLHDHLRKRLKWSDTQVVQRYAALQTMLAMLLYMLLR